MKVIVDLAIVPIGVGVSLAPYVAACRRVLEQAGLEPVMHANGTNIEGEWNQVFGAVKKCHETLHEMGAARISTNMRVGTRTDMDQNMADKIRSVEDELRKTDNG